MNIILLWIVNALSLLIISRLLPGFQIETLYTAFLVALILGLVNAIIKPVLVILTLPITILTLGIFIFFINALMILLTSSIVKGFTVDNFSTAFVASIILWLISLISNWFVHQANE